MNLKSDFEEIIKMELPVVKGIFLGDRSNDFKTLIESVLKKGNLKKKYISVLTSPDSLKEYGSAFTSELIDEVNNYQVYEQLGDLIGNKFIVYYIYKRFPQLKCSEGVKVVARLRINYGSKNSFYQIAEKLGFWNFISATNDLRQRKKKSLLEDVFEAFLGATEYILDTKVLNGVGYACVYKILETIFNEMPISLKYEDLYDAKTILKEIFDTYGNVLGKIEYEDEKIDLITISNVYCVAINKKRIKIGSGSAPLRIDAQQNASKDALDYLQRNGIKKAVPEIYIQFEENNIQTPKVSKTDVIKLFPNINDQYLTKAKNKYQSKYTCTPLIKYCKERNWNGVDVCLELGANPEIEDSDGLNALEWLLIGTQNKKTNQYADLFRNKYSCVKVSDFLAKTTSS